VVTAGSTLFEPTCVAKLHPLLKRNGNFACEVYFPVLRTATSRFFEDGVTFKKSISHDLSFDGFGNLTESLDEADDASHADDIYAKATFQNDPSKWIIGLLTALEVRSLNASGALLRKRSGSYNGFGDLTQIQTQIDSLGTQSSSSFTYDGFGNLLTVTSPPNALGQVQTLLYEYDPVCHQYITKATDGFGYSSQTEYDLGFGLVKKAFDLNGNVMERRYDDFSRLTSVFGPHSASSPVITMEYFPTEAKPRAVTVNRSLPPVGYSGPVPPDITTVSFVDGMGKVIEVKKTAVVNGVLGMTIANPAKYDNVGRTVASYHPFFVALVSTAFINPQVTPKSESFDDGVDRVIESVYPDGTNSTTAYNLATSPQGVLSFHTESVDPSGHLRESFTDGAGRTLAFQEHPINSTTFTTKYEYSPLSELTKILDDHLNATTMSYDLRGLWLSMNNPDTGLITQKYDLQGNLIERIEPNQRATNSSIKFVYEKNRLTSINYPTKADVFHSYGDPGASDNRAGRMVKLTDETGSQEFFYGKLGENLRTLRIIDAKENGKKPVLFETKQSYDSMGRLLQLTYPDGEVLTHNYNQGGQLVCRSTELFECSTLRCLW
jgi:YD repeat-containing protein